MVHHHLKEHTVFKQIKYTTGAVAALAALSLGGAAIAGATGSTPTPAPVAAPAPTALTTPEPASQTDTDTIQSGDQTTPDTVSPTRAAVSTATGPATAGTAGTAGDTADTTDTADTAAETSTEPAGESATASDGPGGHADEPGNPNATTDQQGQN